MFAKRFVVALVCVIVALAFGCGEPLVATTENANAQATTDPVQTAPPRALDVEADVEARVQATVEALIALGVQPAKALVPSVTPPITPTPTATETATPTNSPTRTHTPTPTLTNTPKPVPSPTLTPTPTERPSPVPSPTPTPSVTPTPTRTWTATPVPTATPIPISEWRTYRNSAFGYQIKVPPLWSIDGTDTNMVRFREPSGRSYLIVWIDELGPDEYSTEYTDSVIEYRRGQGKELFELLERSAPHVANGVVTERLTYRFLGDTANCTEVRVETLHTLSWRVYGLRAGTCDDSVQRFEQKLSDMRGTFQIVEVPPTRTPTLTPVPTATPTPMPTATATPTPTPRPLQDEEAKVALLQHLGGIVASIQDSSVREFYWRLLTAKIPSYFSIYSRVKGNVLDVLHILEGPYILEVPHIGLAIADDGELRLTIAYWDIYVEGAEVHVSPSQAMWVGNEAKVLEQEIRTPSAKSVKLARLFAWTESVCSVLKQDHQIVKDVVAFFDTSESKTVDQEIGAFQGFSERQQALQAQLTSVETPEEGKPVQNLLRQAITKDVGVYDYRIEYLRTGDRSDLIAAGQLIHEASLLKEQAKELLDNIKVRYRFDVMYWGLDVQQSVKETLCLP